MPRPNRSFLSLGLTPSDEPELVQEQAVIENLIPVATTELDKPDLIADPSGLVTFDVSNDPSLKYTEATEDLNSRQNALPGVALNFKGQTTVDSSEANSSVDYKLGLLDKDLSKIESIIDAFIEGGYTQEEAVSYIYEHAESIDLPSGSSPEELEVTFNSNVSDLASKLESPFNTYTQSYLELLSPDGSIPDVYAKKESKRLNTQLAEKLADRGIESKLNNFGDVVYKDPFGYETILDVKFLDTLGDQGFEIGGAVIGGTVGASFATAALAAAIGASAAGALPLAFIATLSFAGATLGAGLDTFINELQTKENLNIGTYTRKMVDAGLNDLVGVILGEYAIKPATVSLGTLIKYSWELINSLLGNPQKALTQIQKDLHMTDEVFSDYKAKLIESIGDTSLFRTNLGLKPTKVKLELYALGLATEQGAELFQKVRVPTRHIAKTILDRSKDVKAMFDSLVNVPEKGTDLSNLYAERLNSLDKTIKANYRDITEMAYEIDQTSFRFDYRNYIDLDEDLARVEIGSANNADAVIKEIKSAKNLAKKNPKFSGLLELRRFLNKIKRKLPKESVPVQNILTTSIRRLDGTLKTVADKHLPGWFKEFSSVNEQYAKFSLFKNRSIYKLLTNLDKSNAEIKSLITSKYSTVNSSGFKQLLRYLPKAEQGRIEGVIMQVMVDKHTQVLEGGKSVIDLVALNNSLVNFRFENKTSKESLKLLGDLANIWRADPISLASLGINSKQNKQFIATSFKGRANMAMLSFWTNMASSFMQTPSGLNKRIISIIQSLAHNTLNVKTLDALRGVLPKDSADSIMSSLKEARELLPLDRAIDTQLLHLRDNSIVRAYKVSDSLIENGKDLTRSGGFIYKEVITNEMDEAYNALGDKGNLLEINIPRKLLAGINQIKTLLVNNNLVKYVGYDSWQLGAIGKDLKVVLEENGFKGYQLNGETVVFDNYNTFESLTPEQQIKFERNQEIAKRSASDQKLIRKLHEELSILETNVQIAEMDVIGNSVVESSAKGKLTNYLAEGYGITTDVNPNLKALTDAFISAKRDKRVVMQQHNAARKLVDEYLIQNPRATGAKDPDFQDLLTEVKILDSKLKTLDNAVKDTENSLAGYALKNKTGGNIIDEEYEELVKDYKRESVRLKNMKVLLKEEQYKLKLFNKSSDETIRNLNINEGNQLSKAKSSLALERKLLAGYKEFYSQELSRGVKKEDLTYILRDIKEGEAKVKNLTGSAKSAKTITGN